MRLNGEGEGEWAGADGARIGKRLARLHPGFEGDAIGMGNAPGIALLGRDREGPGQAGVAMPGQAIKRKLWQPDGEYPWHSHLLPVP